MASQADAALCRYSGDNFRMVSKTDESTTSDVAANSREPHELQRDRLTGEIDIIINPASGNGRAGRSWPKLRSQIEALRLHPREHRTAGIGDATRITRELLDSGAREIAVVGGDGTLNEVVNGFFNNGIAVAPEATLSLIPCGTGRDFSRMLKIASPEQAIRLLPVSVVRSIDVGLIHYRANGEARSRCFVNVADVGLGAETAAWINRSSKAAGGFITYLAGVIRTIMVFQGRPATVIVDGEPIHDGPIGMVVLANARYLAGGMRMAPSASLTDGLLDILVLRDVPKRVLLTSLLPSVYRGRHIQHPAVLHLRGKRIEIRSPISLPFEVDGEQPGTTDLQATVLPGALRVRMPYAAAVENG